MFIINRLRLLSMAITSGMLSFTIGCTKNIYNMNPGGNEDNQASSSSSADSHTVSNTGVTCSFCLPQKKTSMLCCFSRKANPMLFVCPNGLQATDDKYPICMARVKNY